MLWKWITSKRFDSRICWIFLPLKREEVWPSDYENFTQTLAAVGHWVDGYNRERPHQALKNRTPHEVRREALESTVSAA